MTSNFNLSRLREYIPKELPNVQLPRMPSWAQSHESMNPDEDQEGPSADSHPLESPTDTRANPDKLILEEPKPVASGPRSYLDLVNECDNFPYYQTDPNVFFARVNSYYGFYVKDYPTVELGYMLPSVAEVFRGLPDWKIDDDDRSLTLLTGSTEEERTRAVELMTKAMRATEHFKVLKGWRDELYPVYGPKGEVVLSMERSASALFGIATYGCHMTAYTMKAKEGDEGVKEMYLWVPRRAASKQTYGGMLDNTVAGGIATGESAFESLVREAQEEASLPEEIVRKGAKAVGTVSYFHIRDQRAGGETRLLQPECQYVYDLELDNDTIPKPSDDEVEGFELKTVEETKQALRDGEFKPNCAMVLLDFFVRHGIITADDEGYIEMVARLHRRLDFPMP